jgi:AcrR family transcriptional regulator
VRGSKACPAEWGRRPGLTLTVTGRVAPGLQGVGSTKEGAAASRARLVEAMTRVIAAHGYRGASVARVAAAAGASRATFYSHFRDREDCFLAAYRAALDALERSCRGAAGSNDPDAVLASLLAAAAAEPERARLLLLEAMAGPRAIREDHHRLLCEAERAAVQQAGCALCLPLGTTHGGVTSVVSAALRAGGDASLGELLPALSTWLRCYAVLPGTRAWDERAWDELGCQVLASPGGPFQGLGEANGAGPASLGRISALRPLLPRGRSAAPRSISAEDRRRRLLEATAEVVARKGYAAASVADIVAAARVTRGAFYSHFGCKLDAFMAVLVKGLQESAAVAAAEFFVPEHWPDRVWNAARAFLTYLAEHPDAAYLGMVEVYAAGDAAIDRAQEQRSAFTLFLADGYRQSERAAALPSLCSDAIAGAIEAMIRRLLLAGKGDRALELLPQCVYVALAPFLGVEAALSFAVSRTAALPAARTA